MRYMISAFILALLCSLAAFARPDNDPILGKWTNASGNRVIEFVKNGDGFDAIIRKAEDSSLIGKKQISGLHKKNSTTYSDGTLYLVNQGKTAACSVVMSSPDLIQLTGKMGLFAKSQQWKRLKS
ncbi:DUF2147 domain-containing protein [Filimonas effusa]|uniref:DUF2147 domain-containing protein n=1 Tax=Filimonas effusa TaxID=2508721 RepID=A0A4Q1D9X3_9BACT|nr:DUF2147 domain-containing protein [Filimonas effusa]RXK85688.1 DUF2147 domain-containing protein [Filimonas effusa]